MASARASSSFLSPPAPRSAVDAPSSAGRPTSRRTSRARARASASVLRRDAPKWAATATFSRIDSFRNGRGIWNVRATPRWQIASGVSPAISSPRNRIDPAVGWRAPEMQLNIVVLPGAVRADQPEDLPLGDLEGHVVQRGEPPEALDEAGHRQERRHRRA